MRAALTINVTVRAPCDIVLDWCAIADARVDAIRINGAPCPNARMVSEHVVIPASTTRAGENEIVLCAQAPIGAPGSALLRYHDVADGSDYVYTLCVPADARTLFPCFDQPDLKGRFTLSLECPSGWQVVSNAPRVAVHRIDTRCQRVQFDASAPISTYLFAFAAGPFASMRERGLRQGCMLWLRRSQKRSGRRAAHAALELNRRALEYFTEYTQRAFPFAKYDLVLIPEFAFNGMEHAGATFLREESVLIAPQAPAVEHAKCANLILHETAHQWFGNLVTMRWFDDVWIKEAFANWLAARAAATLLPSSNPWLSFAVLKSSALQTDSSAGTTPLRQPLSNLADAKSLYGNIVYGKGPALLRQLEHDIGARAFQRGVQSLIAAYAYKTIDRRELIDAFATASGRDLSVWARQWITTPGLPRITVRTSRQGRDGRSSMLVEQRGAAKASLPWPQRFAVASMSARGASRTFDVRLDSSQVRLSAGRTLVGRTLLPNASDFGYGLFTTDPGNGDALLALLPRIKDPLRRWSIWSMVWEAVREAKFGPDAFLRQVSHWLPSEQEPLLLAALSERTQIALRRYCTDAQRDSMAAEIEAVLEAGFTGATRQRDASVRTSFRRAFINVAQTDVSRARLHAWIVDSESADAMTSIDLHHCAQRLLILDGTLPSEVMRALRRRTEAAHRDRLMFATGAAARAAKRSYLDAFLDDRSMPESWIEEALAPFNAPEHARQTQPLLARAIRALPRLKNEHKIFFVNRWVAAFIGGQTSDSALRIVQRELPRLPPDLRRKVLEATDELARTVRIRTRFGRAAYVRRALVRAKGANGSKVTPYRVREAQP